MEQYVFLFREHASDCIFIKDSCVLEQTVRDREILNEKALFFYDLFRGHHIKGSGLRLFIKGRALPQLKLQAPDIAGVHFI